MADILLGYGNAINQVKSGKPTFKSTQFIVDTRFQVLNSSETELGIDFSIVEISGERSRSRTKTQRLLITFGVTGEILFTPAL